MTNKSFTLDDLRPLALFRDLTDDQISWFLKRGRRINLAAGERMFERGSPADFMFLVVSGTIEGYEEIGGEWLLVATTRPGDVTGMLPFSRMTRYPRYTVATEPSSVLRLNKDDFKEMLLVSLEVGQRLVAAMSDRVRGDVRHEQQREKMISLGRLSAGLAHELNNPAAAVRRAAADLRERHDAIRPVLGRILQNRNSEQLNQAMEELCSRAEARADRRQSALEQSETEDVLNDWLEDRGVEDAWKVAGTLSDSGLNAEDLEEVVGGIEEGSLSDLMSWIENELGTHRLLGEMSSSARRISDLISSVKTYSHMDRSSEHRPVDVREGLDNTLTMLGHKVKKKEIVLSREYADGLPTVSGNAGELNQVWTNLIDNALDALEPGGELRIEAKDDSGSLRVNIIDNGPGIPDDVRAHMFEPFFTTKDVGEGTGLGLDIALRIVKIHKGRIDVSTEPGRTVMSVMLPRE